MSSIASISTPVSGNPQASAPVAEAWPRASTGTREQEPAQPTRGVDPPDQAAAQARAKQSASELQKQIEQTMAQAMVQTDLRFRVDEEAERVVVSVIDSNTGETILQIPNEAALAVARRLAATGTGLFDQQA